MLEKEKSIEDLGKQAGVSERNLSLQQDQVEEMERHGRVVNLVLSSRMFGSRRPGEDVKAVAVKSLTEHLHHITVATSDLSTAHRLSRDGVIICAFYDRDLRNKLYYARTQLGNRSAPRQRRLYIPKCLTWWNRHKYDELVTMKQGKLIWSAFSNNGLPGYKTFHVKPPQKPM